MFRKILLTASLAIAILWLGWPIFMHLAGAFVTNGSHALIYHTQKAAPGSSYVLDASDATFNQDVLSAQLPVFVDFYATWCGPCQMMAPVVDGLSVQYKNKVRFLRVDIDRNPQLAAKYQIQSIPAFKIFHGGKAVDGALGVTEENALREKIDRAISSFGGQNKL